MPEGEGPRPTQKEITLPLTPTEQRVMDSAQRLSGEKPATQKAVGQDLHLSKAAVSLFVRSIQEKRHEIPIITKVQRKVSEDKIRETLEKRERREALLDEIQDLHKRGLTKGQMSQKTGRDISEIESAWETLSQRERIKERRKRRKPDQIAADRAEILRLTAQGLSDAQIAKRMGKKDSRFVTNEKSRMYKEGMEYKYRKYKRGSPESQRVNVEILRLTDQGKGVKEIATQVGLTPKAVRERLRRILKGKKYNKTMQDFGEGQTLPNPDKPRFQGRIREFQHEDLPYLRRILEMWVRYPSGFDKEGQIITEEVEEDLQHLRDSLLPGSSERYFVAEAPNGRVVGMMGLVFEPKDPLKPFAKTQIPMELVRAYVDKDFRVGQGVGTSLIHKLEQETKRRGGTEVILDSGPRYEKTGHGFYLKMGYTKVGEIPDYYGPGGTTTVFSKVLN